ncbi:hypothetical protein HOE91_05855 [archaeon]|jgi:amidophosphoribosyltransferase|nr:hypothetical protein [archaeon]
MSGNFGVYSIAGENVADELLLGTVALQHRGEEGCGISYSREKGFFTERSRQLAYYFFRDVIGTGEKTGLEVLREHIPLDGIGHTLYESTGGLQPRVQWARDQNVSLVMDGVLLGYDGKSDAIMRTEFTRALDETSNVYDAVNNVFERFEGRGSYSVISLVKNGTETKLVAFRDPKGIKPLGVGRKGEKVIVGSESKAFDAVEADDFRDVKPGEVIVVSREKGFESQQVKEANPAHCFFEWIYFADPTSVIEGRNVYSVRTNLGALVAERHLDRVSDLDLVMASPDSGRAVAIGFGKKLSELTGKYIPYEEAAIKNPGSKRTFQVENPEERKLAARLKFFINQGVVDGKNLGVGDDSIVRGTVFRDGMIYKLKRASAGKIIPIISCPPLQYACVSDPKGKSFIARGLEGDVVKLGEEVAKRIGADFVCYPTMEDVHKALDLEGKICKACIDGDFPINSEFC